MKTASQREKEISSFENYLFEKGYSNSSVRTYISGIRIFLQSNPNARTYKYSEVLNFFERKAYRPLSLNTRKGYLIHIKKYYDFLLDTGKREDHPCGSLNLKGNSKRAIIHSDLFTMVELETLLQREETFAKVTLKNQTIISLLIYQGLLPGEIVRLKVRDIDLDTGTVTIHGGRVLTSRRLELHIKQIRIIDRYINEARKELSVTDTESLIINYRGLPDKNTESINFLLSTYKGIFPGRNLTTKTIRDSVISYWLNEKKIPLEQAQLMAGHRWISSTERCVQASIDEQREILKKAHPLG